MKLDYLFDTNIFIYLINNRLADSLPKGYYGCSIITEIELLSFPALTYEESNIIIEHLHTITIIGLTEAIKQTTIVLRRKYRLKLPDALIVATTIESNATLLTNDIALQKIDELQSLSLRIIH